MDNDRFVALTETQENKMNNWLEDRYVKWLKTAPIDERVEAFVMQGGKESEL